MVHGVTKSRTRLHDFTFPFLVFLGPSGGAISISTICLTHMVPLCLGSSEGISGKNFSEEPLTSESKPGTQDVWAPIQSGFCICEAPAALSLHSPSNTCCGGWKPRAIVQDPELWPSASAPTLNRHFSWGCSAGWQGALEFPRPLGSRIPSQPPPPLSLEFLPSALPLGLLELGSLRAILHFHWAGIQWQGVYLNRDSRPVGVRCRLLGTRD